MFNYETQLEMLNYFPIMIIIVSVGIILLVIFKLIELILIEKIYKQIKNK